MSTHIRIDPPQGRWGSSIGTRLYAAFAATAGLTVAAGVVANLSFVQVEDSLTTLTDQGVSALEASSALKAGALRLSAIAPELRSAADPTAQAAAAGRIDVEFTAVRSALDMLQATGKIPVSGFEEMAREMRAELLSISRTMEEIERLEGQRLETLDKVKTVHEALLSRTAEAEAEGTLSLERGTGQVVQANGAAIDKLVDGEIAAVRASLEMLADINRRVPC